MDALALLCTLHADGPASLRVLRRAGLSTVDAVDATSPERIAELLGMSPASSQRFLREAHFLTVRASGAPLEVEDHVGSVRRPPRTEPARPGLPRPPLRRRAPREAQDSESLYTLFCTPPLEASPEVKPPATDDEDGDDVAGPFA